MNKKGIASTLLASCILAGTVTAATKLWRGETMTTSAAQKRWGNAPFEADKFKAASMQDRARMAAALLGIRKQFIGKERTQIRETLGDPDGFYFSDMFPAYLVEEAQDRTQESWQIVFLLDRNEKVNDIILHKSCCDR